MTDKMHQFLKSAQAELGDDIAIILDDNVTAKVDVISTGVECINEAIGVGGIPRGKITEVFGKEGTGKTTLCLQTMAVAQKAGLGCLFVDIEHAIDTRRMKELGVDTGKMVFSQPNTGEQALEIAEFAIRSGDFGLVVIDSVAALVPMVEVDKDMGDSVMGLQARLMSQAMRKLAGPVNKNNVALMFTNQVRANIGSYGGGEVTTGGTALKYYASLRIKMKFTGKITDSKGNTIAGKYQANIVKNKVAPPFKTADFELNQYGIDETGGLVDTLAEKGVLTKSGAFYKLDEVVVAQGRQNMAKKLRDEPELREKLVYSLHKQLETPA